MTVLDLLPVRIFLWTLTRLSGLPHLSILTLSFHPALVLRYSILILLLPSPRPRFLPKKQKGLLLSIRKVPAHVLLLLPLLLTLLFLPLNRILLPVRADLLLLFLLLPILPLFLLHLPLVTVLPPVPMVLLSGPTIPPFLLVLSVLQFFPCRPLSK